MGELQITYIYNDLLSAINHGKFHIGDKLPTEMELCKKYKVARSTIREAIRMLCAKGYTEVKKGSGTYIVSLDGIESNVGFYIDKIENLDDFMEIRSTIETLAVRLYINKITPSSLNKLKNIESQFEKAVSSNDVENMVLYDEKFHSYIIESTDNELLINIGKVLSSAFRIYRKKTFSNESNRKDAIYSHNNLINSLKKKDTDEAIFDMREHLKTSLNNAKKGKAL